MPNQPLPKWYVFFHSHIDKAIKQFNIFDHPTFAAKFEKIRKKKLDKDEFAEEIRSILFYHFNSKYEYEVIIGALSNHRKDDEEIKVDIYSQVMLNWDVFIDYIYQFK